MYLSVLWQSVIFIYYGFNAFLLYFFYFYVSFELLVLNIVDIVCYFLNYKFLICYIDLCVCMEDYGIFMDCTKSLIFFIKTQIDFILDVVSVLYFMIQLYLMYILKFFITCF